LKADPRFVGLPKEFWAYVRIISQEVGYTSRTTHSICVPEFSDIREKFERLSLSTAQIADTAGNITDFGRRLHDYFLFRAEALNNTVQGQLMDKTAAQKEFRRLKAELNPKCPLPMNKQKGEKRKAAFLTGIVNMLVEANIGDAPCDYDPRSLTTVTQVNTPLRTFSRRFDGAFPSVVDPIAIWEIKEYYNTTTFGSRVADGVYETLLDGMEMEELEASTGRKVHHLLLLDAHFTWWEKGRSYLCRIIDMLHMGFVDEVIFGREVLTRLPEVAREWKARYDKTAIVC
jgi:hypothetical protein